MLMNEKNKMTKSPSEWIGIEEKDTQCRLSGWYVPMENFIPVRFHLGPDGQIGLAEVRGPGRVGQKREQHARRHGVRCRGPCWGTMSWSGIHR